MENVTSSNNYFEEVWFQLTAKEKALCLNYARLLERDEKIKNEMVLDINLIHDKYPDFSMICVPLSKAPAIENKYEAIELINQELA